MRNPLVVSFVEPCAFSASVVNSSYLVAAFPRCAIVSGAGVPV